MPANQFLPFATAGGAFVLSNAAYTVLPARLSGYLPGLLTKEALNSAVRQGAFVAAALSQVVADESGLDVLDDGVVANWGADFRAAFRALLRLAFRVNAGNPNGVVAGQQGVPGGAFPDCVWDTTNAIWWVCTTTGNAAAAVWTETGALPAWPFFCGTSTGTAAVQVLATPAVMTTLANNAVSWKIGAGLTNVGAVSVTVGAFGTWPVRKDGPAGPVALTGGELVAGNFVSARFDGAALHLTATEMGTAALADASSSTGTVAAVQGAGTIPIGNLAIFKDARGTLGDGGVPGGLAAPVYINIANNGQTLAPGVYLVDTSLGAFAVNLPAAPTLGACLEFIDAAGTWSPNNFTVNRNGKTIMGVADNLVCNVGGEDFRTWYDNTNTWRFE